MKALDGSTRIQLQNILFLTDFSPAANAAIHGDYLGVSHLLQVIGGQCGAEASATIKYELSLQVGNLALDVALDDALAEVDGSGEVVGGEFAVFADVDQNEFLAAIETGFDRVNGGFADAPLGVVHNLQKARRMLMSHGESPGTNISRIALGCQLSGKSCGVWSLECLQTEN